MFSGIMEKKGPEKNNRGEKKVTNGKAQDSVSLSTFLLTPDNGNYLLAEKEKSERTKEGVR